MIVTDAVVYMQNRAKGIEHEIGIIVSGDRTGEWGFDDGKCPVDRMEKLIKESRIRTKKAKTVDPEVAREMYELLTRLRNHISGLAFDGVGITKGSPFYTQINDLLTKQKESDDG